MKSIYFSCLTVNVMENAAAYRASQFVLQRLPGIYLASLLIGFFMVNDKILPEGRVAALLDVSSRICAYYAVLAAFIGFTLEFLYMASGAPVKSEDKPQKLVDRILNELLPSSAGLFLFKFIAQVVLLWALVCYYNLFLTAFGHLWTFVVEQANDSVQPPQQTLLEILFDTRLSRRPLSFGIGTFFGFGPLFTETAKLVTGVATGGTTSAIDFGGETVKAYFTGRTCENTWGQANKTMLFQPVKRDYNENFMGRLCWLVEDAAIGPTDGVTGVALSCAALRFSRAICVLLGLLAADSFFQAAVSDNNLETNQFAAPKEPDVFNKSSAFLKRNGLVCSTVDFANFLGAIKGGDNGVYKLSVQKSLLIEAMNRVDGSYEEYAKKTGQKIGAASFQIKDYSNVLEILSAQTSQRVKTEFERLGIELTGFRNNALVNPEKARIVYDFANEWNAMGFNSGPIFRAVEEGKLDPEQPIPKEYALNFMGLPATIEGEFIPLDPEVQDAVTRTVKLFPDPSCELGFSKHSCCDTVFRPFNDNLGAKKKLTSFYNGYYKVNPIRY